MKQIQTLLILLLLVSLLGCIEEPFVPVFSVKIKGKVFELDTEAPVFDARITILNTSDFTDTDSTGFFQFDSLNFRESFTLRVEKAGYIDRSLTVSFDSEGSMEREVEVPLSFDLAINAAPSPSALLQPANGAVDVSVQPVLRWTNDREESEEALSFTVHVFDDANPTGQHYTTTDTTLVLEVLKYDHTYYWQVVADNGNNDPVASLVHSFRTESFPDYRIFFVREDAGTGNLVVHAAERPLLTGNSDSLRSIAITDPGQSCWRPHYHPEADQVAYIAYSGIEPHLFTMDRDGGNVRQVTSSKSITSFNLLEVNYSWSPNGGQLVYPHEDKLYVINENGSGLRELVTADLGYFFVEVDWSDQDVIVARMQRADRYQSQIALYDTGGKLIRYLIDEQLPQRWYGGPVLSEGSDFIIYVEDREAQRFPDEQPRRTQLLRRRALGNFSQSPIVNDGAIPPNTNDLYPCIPPGGELVLFVNRPSDRSRLGDVYYMTIGGTSGEGRTLVYRNATMPDWR